MQQDVCARPGRQGLTRCFLGAWLADSLRERSPVTLLHVRVVTCYRSPFVLRTPRIVGHCSGSGWSLGPVFIIIIIIRSAGCRSRRQWGSACAMRLARSAPSCNQGTPGHSKIAQRRRGGWLRPGRRDPGRRRRLGGCVKTRRTRRCAVRAGFGTALLQGEIRAQTQTTQGSDLSRLAQRGYTGCKCKLT